MSNQPVPDPVEATFRDLRGAVYAGDGLRLALARGATVPHGRRKCTSPSFETGISTATRTS